MQVGIELFLIFFFPKSVNLFFKDFLALVAVEFEQPGLTVPLTAVVLVFVVADVAAVYLFQQRS